MDLVYRLNLLIRWRVQDDDHGADLTVSTQLEGPRCDLAAASADVPKPTPPADPEEAMTSSIS